MIDFLRSIQESGVCTWIRGSDSIFAYSGVLLLHTIGMGFVVGVNTVIDIRILGFAPAVRLSGMEKFFPVLWAGFWVNAITGTILVAIDAVHKLENPDFYVKMAFIALALINLRMLRMKVFRNEKVDTLPLPIKARWLAATSLLFWLGAIISGRLLAYLGPGSG